MGTLCQKCNNNSNNNNKLGVTTLVSVISCAVDHAKLPNLVSVAVIGFLEKNESLSITGRKTM